MLANTMVPVSAIVIPTFNHSSKVLTIFLSLLHDATTNIVFIPTVGY